MRHSDWCTMKTDELFISGIFHLIFSDLSSPWVTGTVESKTEDKRGYCIRDLLRKERKSNHKVLN